MKMTFSERRDSANNVDRKIFFLIFENDPKCYPSCKNSSPKFMPYTPTQSLIITPYISKISIRDIFGGGADTKF